MSRRRKRPSSSLTASCPLSFARMSARILSRSGPCAPAVRPASAIIINVPRIHIPPIISVSVSQIDVAIVGGGITGLTAAYELTRRGRRVTVFEASGPAGGLLRTDHANGFTIEAGPDSLLSTKPAGLELVQELGLGPDVIHVRTP